ncbi:MAG: hypothetical protein AAGD00_09150 [Planctomycetota bacterium]
MDATLLLTLFNAGIALLGVAAVLFIIGVHIANVSAMHDLKVDTHALRREYKMRTFRMMIASGAAGDYSQEFDNVEILPDEGEGSEPPAAKAA